MLDDISRVMAFLRADAGKVKIAVVGDVMLDRYYFGEVKRISPEAPVPVTRVLEEREVLGGAANVAKNLAGLGCQVELAGVTGDDYNRHCLDRLLGEARIGHAGLLAVKSRPTTTKLRVIGGHQQMLRLDFEEAAKLDAKTAKKLRDAIEAALCEAQCLIISDYAKGVCERVVCQTAIRLAQKAGMPVVIDPKGADWRKYAGADFITPNLKELGEAVHAVVPNEDMPVEKAAEKIRRKAGIKCVVVTRSEKGLSVVGPERSSHMPTQAQEVFDVSGAGDTVIAVLGAAVAAGLSLPDSAQLANIAAGVAVGKLGTYAVNREELARAVELHLAGQSGTTKDNKELRQ